MFTMITMEVIHLSHINYERTISNDSNDSNDHSTYRALQHRQVHAMTVIVLQIEVEHCIAVCKACTR